MQSKRWIDEHVNDEYVKKAADAGYRCRAVYKLLEIQERDHILKPGMRVVDLGAAPGGWTEMARQILGPKGDVCAIDLLEIEPIQGVHFIQGDFTEEVTLDALLAHLGGEPVDVVLSDMAPNISGQKSVDQPKALYLVELALDCALQILKPGGVFLTKVFQGAGAPELTKTMRQHFKTVKVRKPRASRARSSEIYLLCQGKL